MIHSNLRDGIHIQKIGQVQFPVAGAVLACLGEARQTALCVCPLRHLVTNPSFPLENEGERVGALCYNNH
jgi:hypothetical protein